MLVAAVQMTSTPDKAANLAAARRLVAHAADRGAQLVALPEMFNLVGSAAELRAGAEALDGPSLTWAREEAQRRGIWLLAGSIMEAVAGEDRVSNTSCLVAPDGEVVAVYRKIHLFDVDVPDFPYHESATVRPGDALVCADAGPLRLGMAVCYDLRFPELFRALALDGATVVVLPSAFTAVTGPPHWEPLLRARAIEEGCFVVAPDQWGASTERLRWHGHTMIVDPWGTVLAQVPDGEGVIVADLDPARVDEARARVPSLQNRRPDVYEPAMTVSR